MIFSNNFGQKYFEKLYVMSSNAAELWKNFAKFAGEVSQLWNNAYKLEGVLYTSLLLLSSPF